MKFQKCILTLMIGLLSFLSIASTVTVEWCPSNSQSVTGYSIYYTEGNDSTNWSGNVYDTNVPCSGKILIPGTNWIRGYTNSLNAGMTLTATVSNLLEGHTYYFAVVAYDTNGMLSDYSNEYRYTVPSATNSPPSQPQNFGFSGVK